MIKSAQGYFDEVLDTLTKAAEHYEKSAPTVSNWCNDLFIRINENGDAVALSELTFLSRFVEEDTWMQPNYAANQLYHLLHRLGRDTSGMAGF